MKIITKNKPRFHRYLYFFSLPDSFTALC